MSTVAEAVEAVLEAKVQEAAMPFRSVKASNLKPGHMMQHEGEVKRVESATATESPLNGKRVKVVLSGAAGKDTVHLPLGQRMSVTSDAVAEAVDSPKVPLKNKPGVSNWVEKFKALGDPATNWINRTAQHLQGKGMKESRAIAVAVNAARRMCGTGDTNFPGVQQVNPGSRADACAAVSTWEGAKAKANAAKVSEAEVCFAMLDDPRALNEAEHRMVIAIVRDDELHRTLLEEVWLEQTGEPVQEGTLPPWLTPGFKKKGSKGKSADDEKDGKGDDAKDAKGDDAKKDDKPPWLKKSKGKGKPSVKEAVEVAVREAMK